MTIDELHDAIFASPSAKALADAGDDAGCAALIGSSLPAVVVSPTYLSERGVIALFGNPLDGLGALSGIDAASKSASPLAPLLLKVLEWLRPPSDGVDFGLPMVRATLDELQAAGVLTADQVTTLKRAAERPAIVAADDVSRAWLRHRPNGRVQA